MTNDGPVPNATCALPFKFVDSRNLNNGFGTYNTCITDYNGKAWCPTELTNKKLFAFNWDDHAVTDDMNRSAINNISRNWGYCRKDCPLTYGQTQNAEIFKKRGKFKNIIYLDNLSYYIIFNYIWR